MRWRMILGLGMMLLLAACGGQQAAPTQAPVATAAENSVTETPGSNVVVVTLAPRDNTAGSLPVEPPGTLVASETEDPNSGEPFTLIQLVRIRGNDQATREELFINPDGVFNYNGQLGTATPAQVERINALIVEVNFFGLQGNLLGPVVEGTDNYQYGLTVTRGETSRTIASMDGYMPQPYIQLLGAVLEVVSNLPVTPAP